MYNYLYIGIQMYVIELSTESHLISSNKEKSLNFFIAAYFFVKKCSITVTEVLLQTRNISMSNVSF